MISELSEECLVQVGAHQGSVLSPLLLIIVVENAREGLVNKIMHADGLVLINESMKNSREKFLK